jgi:hypothetical protein
MRLNLVGGLVERRASARMCADRSSGVPGRVASACLRAARWAHVEGDTGIVKPVTGTRNLAVAVTTGGARLRKVLPEREREEAAVPRR